MSIDQEQTASLERYTKLRNELQRLYNNTAEKYDPTSGGYFFAPHGMCQTEIVFKMVDSFHAQVTSAEQTMANLEEELKKFPYIPTSPHPMIILQSNLPSVTHTSNGNRLGMVQRNEIIRKITNSMADKLIAQDGLEFWKSVRIASHEYMEEIKGMFMEKAELRQRILVHYGIALPSW